MRIPRVAAGSYTLAVKKPNYRTNERPLELSPGDDKSEDVALLPHPGMLTIEPNMDGVEITIVSIGRFQSVVDLVIAPGVYQVEAVRRGYNPARFSVEVLPGTPVSAPVTLVDIPTTLAQAARTFVGADYERTINHCLDILTLETEHPRANNLLGASYFRTQQYGQSTFHLQKAVRLGERISLPIKLYRDSRVDGGLFSGRLEMEGGAISYRGDGDPRFDFDVAAQAITEQKFEAQKNARLQMKISITRQGKQKRETYNFYPRQAGLITSGRSRSVVCADCIAEMQTIYELLRYFASPQTTPRRTQ